MRKKDGIFPLRQPHRDYYEIIKQILQNVYSKTSGCRPSELAYRCELTWHQFVHYRDILLCNNLLIPLKDGLVENYKITEKGTRLLKILAEIEDDLKSV
jgi:predicted transcriptional regulator